MLCKCKLRKQCYKAVRNIQVEGPVWCVYLVDSMLVDKQLNPKPRNADYEVTNEKTEFSKNSFVYFIIRGLLLYRRQVRTLILPTSQKKTGASRLQSEAVCGAASSCHTCVSCTCRSCTHQNCNGSRVWMTGKTTMAQTCHRRGSLQPKGPCSPGDQR